MSKITYTIEIILQRVGLREEDVLRYIESNIISPYDEERLLFDDEDLRRLELVCDLKDNCNPNDESLQIMLHLIDQIHYLQALNKKTKE